MATGHPNLSHHPRWHLSLQHCMFYSTHESLASKSAQDLVTPSPEQCKKQATSPLPRVLLQDAYCTMETTRPELPRLLVTTRILDSCTCQAEAFDKLTRVDQDFSPSTQLRHCLPAARKAASDPRAYIAEVRQAVQQFVLASVSEKANQERRSAPPLNRSALELRMGLVFSSHLTGQM